MASKNLFIHNACHRLSHQRFGILHRQQGPVNEQAMTDCIRTIQSEYQASQVTTEDDLLAVRERLKERKGIKA